MPLVFEKRPQSSRAWCLLKKAAVHARRRGWRDTCRRIVLRAAAVLRQWRLGVRTDGSIEAARLCHDAHSFGYQPVPFDLFDTALRHVPLRVGQDVFLDFGSGMGRAVLLAAQHRFRRVIGVELSRELCDVAADNLRRAQRRLRCADIEIVHADARHYRIPDDVTVVHMFNPFDESILAQVVQRLRQSLERRPREITIIYVLPRARRDALADVPWLRKTDDVATIHGERLRLAIYRGGPHPVENRELDTACR